MDHFECDPLMTKGQIGITKLSFACKKLIEIAKFKSFYVYCNDFVLLKRGLCISNIKTLHIKIYFLAVTEVNADITL